MAPNPEWYDSCGELCLVPGAWKASTYSLEFTQSPRNSSQEPKDISPLKGEWVGRPLPTLHTGLQGHRKQDDPSLSGSEGRGRL